jgi:hypothetical protein
VVLEVQREDRKLAIEIQASQNPKMKTGEAEVLDVAE